MLILCGKMFPRGMIHCLFWKKQSSLWPLTLLLCRLRDRVTVKTGPRHIVRETDNSTFEMIIKSAVGSDAGIYTCKIINEYGTKQCEGKLQVQGMVLFRFLCTVATTLCLLSSAGCGSWVVLLTYILSNALCVHSAPSAEPAVAVIRPLKDIIAKAGETVLFECHILGPKDTDVDWLTDGRLIQPALLNCKMHFDGRKCRLLLKSVHEDDSGTYTCKLSTAKG